MTLEQLKKKNANELAKHADSLRIQIASKKRALAMAEETNHQTVKKLKRELARTLTLMTNANQKVEEK